MSSEKRDVCKCLKCGADMLSDAISIRDGSGKPLQIEHVVDGNRCLRNQLRAANEKLAQAERRVVELEEFARWVTSTHAAHYSQYGGCHVHNCRVCRIKALLAQQAGSEETE